MAYSPAVLDHFQNPRNTGVLPDADAVGKSGTPGRGNYMIIHLKIEDGRISNASFQTYGCPGVIACGSMITTMAKGKTIDEARKISRPEIIDRLGGLPLGKHHCAGLAAAALHDALGKINNPAQ